LTNAREKTGSKKLGQARRVAHPSSPIARTRSGTVGVTVGDGKSVEVRINDRGPFTKGRVIDLSRAAARALGMVESGVSPVQMELLSPREMSNDLVLQNSQSRSGNRQ
jgi:rare lipoprotein A